jgi:hypothetical protein
MVMKIGITNRIDIAITMIEPNRSVPSVIPAWIAGIQVPWMAKWPGGLNAYNLAD